MDKIHNLFVLIAETWYILKSKDYDYGIITLISLITLTLLYFISKKKKPDI